MSTFRFSSGTQKLWITSSVETIAVTLVRTGMWISFAVTTFESPYRTSHHHWCPITCTVTGVRLVGAATEFNTKRSDQMNSATSRTTGNATPRPITTPAAARSPWPPGRLGRSRRIPPRKSSATITAKPMHDAPNITQKRWVIERSGCPAGAIVFWLPPQPANARASGGASKAARVISRATDYPSDRAQHLVQIGPDRRIDLDQPAADLKRQPLPGRGPFGDLVGGFSVVVDGVAMRVAFQHPRAEGLRRCRDEQLGDLRGWERLEPVWAEVSLGDHRDAGREELAEDRELQAEGRHA